MAKKRKFTEAEREKLIDEIVELYRQLGLIKPDDDDDTETGGGCIDMTGSDDTKTA